MKYIIQKHLVPALLACLVFFTTLPFLESMMRLHDKYQPAITWHSVRVVNKEVRPGDILELVYTITVNKQCPSDLRAFIVAPDGSVPVRLPTVAGGYTRPSSTPIDVRVRISIPKTSDNGLAAMETGVHTYRATATRYCPDGVEVDNAVPDAPFMLLVGDRPQIP